MPCHPKALERYARMIRTNPTNADFWLDEWIDATTRATEWDADQWGFDPDRWMLAERLEMDQRASGED
jgi:hypothetical protein